MTDKQIIIDGVDVSGCSALIEDYQRANNIEGRYEHIKNVCELGERGVEEFWLECKNNPNCYYKQLKRKEQDLNDYKKQFKADTKEMEDYQNEIVRHLESIEHWQHQAEAKEQECEELKKISCKFKDYCTCDTEKLKQTLTEIKEIAEKCCCLQPTSTCEEYENCKECSRTSDDETVQQILQKISEVEDERN